MFIAGRVRFATKEDKLRYMARGAFRDARRPEVLRWAGKFQPIVDRDLMRGVRAIFRFVRDGVLYVKDPQLEVLDAAPAGLERGYGDCDLKARLFVALCLACGIDAALDPVFRGDQFPHIRALVRVGDHWYRADPTIVNSDVGIPPIGRPRTTYA